MAHVYIMTNVPSGTLYMGRTGNLAARVHQHRSGTGSDFCREHRLTILVLVQEYPTMLEAIAREKALKRWKRSWKLILIGKANPNWDDLYDIINS